MKKFFAYSLSVLFLLLSVILASCGDDTPSYSATGDFTLNKATNSSLVFDVEVTDIDNEITKSSIQVVVYDQDGDEDGYVICSNLEKQEGSSKQKERVRIDSLRETYEYTCKLECTIGEYAVVLAEKKYSTNDLGTEGKPILIKTLDDLKDMSKDLDAYYKLENDIDLGNVEFEPLFNNSTSKLFTGSFDGDGHTIKNFKQNSAYTYYGLFGYISAQARVCNLVIENVNIEITRYIDTYISAFAGHAEVGATISGITVKNANIKATNSATNKTFTVGGIVALNAGATISNCSFEGKLDVAPSRGLYVGGICGVTSGSSISNCYSNAEIKVAQYTTSKTFTNGDEIYQFVGSICGLVNSTAEVLDCASKGSIDATFKTEYSTSEQLKTLGLDHNVQIGGLVGTSSGYIDGCATTVSIKFESNDAYLVHVGLLVGLLKTSSAKVLNCYYDGTNATLDVKLCEADGIAADEKNPAPEYERVFHVGLVARKSSTSSVVKAFAVLPQTSMSSLVTETNYNGNVSSITELTLKENVLNYIQ